MNHYKTIEQALILASTFGATYSEATKALTALRELQAKAGEQVPSTVGELTEEQRKAAAICLSANKVSVSMVQRTMNIGYNAAQDLCQMIIDMGLVPGLTISPSLRTAATQPAQQAQKPVGEVSDYEGRSLDHTKAVFNKTDAPIGTKLYTGPSRPMVQQARDALTQVHGDFHLMPGRVGPQEAFLMAREAIAALNKWLEVNP